MPTAAIIAGGLGAGGNVISGLIGSNAAQTASQQQVSALQQAIQQVQQIYGTGTNAINNLYQQGAGVLTPIIKQGQGIVSGVSPLIKNLLSGGQTAQNALSSTPGFQFAKNQGQIAVQNAGSATGLGGNTLTAGAQYAEGLAGNTYSNVLNAAQAYMNSGVQETAAGAGPFGSLTGNAIGTTGTLTGQLGGTIGGLLTNIGQAQAQGTLGSANAFSSAVTGGAGSLGNAFLLSQLAGKIGGGANSSGVYSGSGPATTTVNS